MTLFKIQENKKDILLAWGARLMSDLSVEATQALIEENATKEFAYMFSINNKWYVFAHTDGENIIPANPNREINVEHKKILNECLGEKIPLTKVYSLKV